MNQITVRVPDTLIEALDAAAMESKRSRTDIVRKHWNNIWRTLTTSPYRWNGYATPLTRYWTGIGSNLNYSVRIKRSAPGNCSDRGAAIHRFRLLAVHGPVTPAKTDPAVQKRHNVPETSKKIATHLRNTFSPTRRWTK